jgi:hypothetical protein
MGVGRWEPNGAEFGFSRAAVHVGEQGVKSRLGATWNCGDFDYCWRRPIDVAIRCINMQTVANGSGGTLVALFATASPPQNAVAGVLLLRLSA